MPQAFGPVVMLDDDKPNAGSQPVGAGLGARG